ncbi:hypothetical protein F5Y13DRAFT_153130 [Hypoxylon sp. FL1857]|nr:hypothetical protein F5Y13DRAFT_153130 [Hypoxylon sp. FL1857]
MCVFTMSSLSFVMVWLNRSLPRDFKGITSEEGSNRKGRIALHMRVGGQNGVTTHTKPACNNRSLTWVGSSQGAGRDLRFRV